MSNSNCANSRTRDGVLKLNNTKFEGAVSSFFRVPAVLLRVANYASDYVGGGIASLVGLAP